MTGILVAAGYSKHGARLITDLFRSRFECCTAFFLGASLATNAVRDESRDRHVNWSNQIAIRLDLMMANFARESGLQIVGEFGKENLAEPEWKVYLFVSSSFLLWRRS